MSEKKLDPLKIALQRAFGKEGARNADQKALYKFFIQDPMLRTTSEEMKAPQTSRDLAITAYKKAFKPE